MMKEKVNSDGRVYAMKDGGRKVFSVYQWNTGIPQKVGWVECGKTEAIPEVETEQVEIKEVETEQVEIKTVKIPKDEVVEETPKEGTSEEGKEADEPSVDEIKKYLYGLADEGKIKRPHHMMGEKKLRALYHENTK